MILDTEVEIVLSPRYIHYWEDKGYTIQRERDQWGRLKVKRGSTIIVNVNDLSKNSHILVSCKCIKCGTIRNVEYCQYSELCGECNHGIRSGELHPFYGSTISDDHLAKARSTKIENGTWISDDKLDQFSLYRKRVKHETNKWKDILFESWNGLDYYTDDKLVTNDEFRKLCPNLHVNRNKLQPTIDHKDSVHFGFINDIDPKIIGGIDNLCICAKVINSTKNKLSEKQYKDNN